MQTENDQLRRKVQKLKRAKSGAVESHEQTDQLIEELSREIVELTDENKQLHTLQEELSLDVLELTQELEALQETLDRRRADEQQDTLRKIAGALEERGELDADELLQQIASLSVGLEQAERRQVQAERQLQRVQREHTAELAARHEKIGELETLLTMATDGARVISFLAARPCGKTQWRGAAVVCGGGVVTFG